MGYFDTYVSNSIAGSSNQSYFFPEEADKAYTARAEYKIAAGGRYEYSFLFSNVLDGTYFKDYSGGPSMVLDEWDILAARVSLDGNEYVGLEFDGKSSKKVAPGEFFYTDPVFLDIKEGGSLIMELTFKGKMLPCHPETLVKTEELTENGWQSTKFMPLPGMIGCRRDVKARINFIGDSITQGIGTVPGDYSYFAAIISEKAGAEFAYWNIGIGKGRASDAAGAGAWFYKMKQAEAACVCYGVNDILNGADAASIKKSLNILIDNLKRCGMKILLQTVPPFDFEGEMYAVWQEVNTFIREELSKKADAFFDNEQVLSVDNGGIPRSMFDRHPNSEQHIKWAKELYPIFLEFVEKIVSKK